MKKTILATLLILAGHASPTLAKVDPKFQELRDSVIQCDVTFVSSYENGVLVKKTPPTILTMETFTQDGKANFTDAKCFIVPAVYNSNGAETVLGFGCLPIDDKHVRTFTSEKLVMKRSSYNEVIEIDFTTGVGSHSFHTLSCDWGRKCVELVGKAEFRNCTIN